MICFECFGIKFRFHWLSAVLATLLFIVFTVLGFWQFGKAQAKLEALTTSQALASRDPVNIRDLSFGGLTSDRVTLQGKSVFINGRYLNDKNIFLIYKHYQDMIGYEVITPFRVQEDDGVVLVSRGWATAPSPEQLVEKIVPVLGDIRLTGQIYVPESDASEDSELKDVSWPLIIKKFGAANLGQLFDGPIYPYVVRASQDAPGVLVRYWPVINPDLGMHFSYAMQWFGMALSVLAVFGIACTGLKDRFIKWLN